MAEDVLRKIIPANAFVNGGSVASADPIGNFDKLAPRSDTNNLVMHSGVMSGDSGEKRLNDYSYYTA